MPGCVSEADDLGQLVCPHVMVAIKDCSVATPAGVKSQINTPQFNNALTQNTIRKDCFLDLWRNYCWTMSAPGQPPTIARRWRVLSRVRQAHFLAADLSAACLYALNSEPLMQRKLTRSLNSVCLNM